MAQDIIQEIKRLGDCRSEFRRFWPDHYREQGNCACPFHEDGTPSLQVDKDLAYCHAEGRKWDIIDLRMAGAGVSKADAIRELAAVFGLAADKRETPLDIETVFKRRGIGKATFDLIRPRLELLRGNRKYPPALAIPLTDWSGKSLGKQFIPLDGGDKKFSRSTPAKEAFYLLEGTGPLVIVEGFWDAVSIKEVIPEANVVAILSAGFTDKLKGISGEPIIFLDWDVPDPKTGKRPGQEGAQAAVKILRGRCRVVDYFLVPGVPENPEGRKWDPNDLLKAGHREIIRRMAEEARKPDREDDDSGPSVLPPPPDFPKDTFHPFLAGAVWELAAAFDVSATVPTVTILSFAGACIGRTRGITIKSGWSEHPNLYVAIVGKSGTGKTPVADLIRRILTDLEIKWREDFAGAMAQYEADLEGWKIDVDARKKEAREQAALCRITSLKLPDKPKPPVLREIMAEDATIEGVGDMMAANSRGIIWYRDELAGLILDLDKYSGKDGSGRSRLLSAFGSGLWKGTRKDVLKRTFIPHAALSIFGGIQPRLLPKIFQAEDTEAGFTPRFLFARVQRDIPPVWSEAVVSDQALEILRRMFERFLSWDFDANGRPHFIGVSLEAKTVFTEWFNHQAAEPFRDPDAQDDEAMLSKLRSYALRFALILHCMDAVMDGASELEPVTRDQMRRAIALAETFTEHHRQCRRFYAPSEEDALAVELDPIQKRVVGAIVALEDEIRSGMLATARIAEAVNAGMDERFHISPDKVGKVVRGLGLSTGKIDRNTRAVVVQNSDLQRLGDILSASVQSVSRVPKQGGEPIKGGRHSVSVVSPSVSRAAGDTRRHFDSGRKPAWIKR